MYSPLFDVPVRRVKPLPKRRRMQAGYGTESDFALSIMDDNANPPLPQPGPFALPSGLPHYYLPIFNGVQDMFADSTTLDFPISFGGIGGAVVDDDPTEGDYVDHLQHPGNTKKRKVPAAQHFPGSSLSSPDPTSSSTNPPGEDPVVPLLDPPSSDPHPLPPSSVASTSRRKTRGSLVTVAGLQHKELLKTRKRQLATVLGAISYGDTLALEQALSARYPQLNKTPGDGVPVPPPLRQSKRPNRRAARLHQSHPPSSDNVTSLPTSEFPFACHSAITDRLIATREEVAVLHARFEVELARQAAFAAEAAKRASSAGAEGSKRSERHPSQRARTSGSGMQVASGMSLDPSSLGLKPRDPKKKKRSALANASNPHHLRNYVPSRFPHSGQPPNVNGPATANVNTLGPLPLRFLTAEIAPRRRSKSKTEIGLPQPLSQLTVPSEEWICPFCEYNLFYGSEVGFRRAVQSRKRILRRRRRAQERAAAAASGNVTSLDKGVPSMEDSSSEMEGMTGLPVGKSGTNPTVGKRDRNKVLGTDYGNLPER